MKLPGAGARMRCARGVLRAGLACLLALGSGASESATGVALLPFENVSGHPGSPAILMPLIGQALRGRGYEVVGQDALEPSLFRQRVRATSKLSREELAALGREFQVPLALVGSVDLFADSPGNPQWGISGRLLETASGAILWANTAGFTGDDFTGFLGRGTITAPDELASRTVQELFHDFPPAGTPVEALREGGAVRPRPRGVLRGVFRDPRLETEPPRRVAVLPFENGTDRRGAALIVDDLMVVGLFRAGRYAVADPGEVHHALQALGLAPYGGIDLEALRRIGEKAGVDAVILGRVEEYNEGLRLGASRSPSIALEARMLATKTGTILWMGSRAARGEEFQLVLEFGKIKSMVPLAMKVIADLVGTM